MVTHDFLPNPRGGEGVVAGTLAHMLIANGFDLEVVAPRQKNSHLYDHEAPFVIHRVDIKARTFVRRMPSFYIAAAPIVREFTGDLVYYLRPTVVRKDLPSVMHFHTTRYGEAIGCIRAGAYFSGLVNFLFFPLERIMARSVDVVIVLTDLMKREVATFSGLEESSIRVLNNPIGLDFWAQTEGVQEGHEEHEQLRLLYVGRLDARKGIFDLLNAFNLCRMQSEEISLSVIGEGPMLGKLQKWVKRNGYEESVTFHGRVCASDLRKIYKQHDLLVVPSLYEPFGMVIAEALASGATVISSDACVDLGQYQFPAGDIPALVEFILKAKNVCKTNVKSVSRTLHKPAVLQELTEEKVGEQLLEIFGLAEVRHSEQERS